MKDERKTGPILAKLLGLCAAVMVVSTVVLPVAALYGDPLPDYRHIWVPMTNGARFNESGGAYYFELDGGGLNALHITNSSELPYGQVNHGNTTSGTFYITDTGGRGYDDDIILMLAVNGTIPQDFNLHLESDGYVWTPTADGSIPDEVYISDKHRNNVIDNDFGIANFTDYYQIWKPSTSSNYRIYNSQDMGDTARKFSLMFIDLKAGALGLNTTTGYSGDLVDNGAVRVDYTFTNLGSLPAAFNAYAWCNQSNQGEQTVSWTNKLDGTSSGTSGWDFNI